MVFERHQIDKAIDRGEFLPFFQPIVYLRTGELQGFELLARWRHPEHGLIPPGEFIPLAEKDGWIGVLTQSLLRQGFCALLSAPGEPQLAVNISPVQLQDGKLPEQIRVLSERSGFPMGRLTIEITESALTQDLVSARRTVSVLKELGCKLSLDDFGTGYSSLAQLQSLPFDKLKVDRSFVGAMTERRDSRKIVAAVVGLGLSLGLNTVAEGVETGEQAEMLRWMGCEQGQGYLFGRPMPAEELAAAISRMETGVAPSPPADPLGKASSGSLEWLPSQRLAQLRAVYDGAPVGLAFLDSEMRYVQVNKRLANINGRPMTEHLGRTVAEVIPEVFPQVEPSIRRALRGESIAGVEFTKPSSAPNAGATLLVSYEPARDEAGEVVGVSVAVMDITSIKQMQLALSESEEHFRFMLELLPTIPWIIDPEGRALAVSRRWMEITGTSDEDWQGLGWLKSLHPDDVQPTQERMRQSFASGEPIDLSYRVRRSARAPWKWVRARGSPRVAPDGTIVSWYGCLEPVDGNW
ncbi:MAG TPA: EAL domain-containing protein [Terracidiphilus sp.]|nr:EAL domain-containing protein [Terracidiphilus sp.]